MSERVKRGVYPAFTSDFGGGGGTARRFAAIAAAIALVAAVAGLLTGASAQTSDISVSLSRVIPITRTTNEPIEFSSRSLPNEAIISGTVTIRAKFAESVVVPTLASFSATNATLSNLRTSTLGLSPPNRAWLFDLTPTAAGAVTVSLAAGTIRPFFASSGNRRNAAASLSLTAELGAPKAVWMGFTSSVTRTLGPFVSGREVDLTVTFSEHVTVVGSPTVQLQIGSSSPTATYESGSGTAALRFRCTVPAEGLPDRVASPRVIASAIVVPSGASIQDGGGTNAALALPPRITRVESRTRARVVGQAAAPWGPGRQAVYKVFFSEAVTVTEPSGGSKAHLQLRGRRDGGGNVDVRAVYSSGSGSNELTFIYTWDAADSLAATSGLYMREIHLFVPNGVGVRNAAGIDVMTQRPGITSIRVGVEGTQIAFSPRLSSGPSADLRLTVGSGDPARVSLSPSSFTFRCVLAQCNDVDGNTYSNTDTADWRRARTLVATLANDADTGDNRVDLTWAYASDPNGLLGNWNGATGTYVRLLIEDDDPEITSLTALDESITEGQAARFRIRTSQTPAAAREVRATLAQAGSCLASSVTDVDGDAAGLQVDAALQADGAQGVATLSIATVDDAVMEADCLISVTLTPPSDAADARFFVLPGDAVSLSAQLMVLDNDAVSPPNIPPGPGGDTMTPGREDPGADDLPGGDGPGTDYPEPPHPPELMDLTIVEGESAEGEFGITRSDIPQAAIEFLHRFSPDGALEASPPSVTFSRLRWWERKAWSLATVEDADSEDERVRWWLDAESDDFIWDGIYVNRADIVVLDDDPQVSALEALDDVIMEGEAAVFRIRLSKRPLDAARTLRVSLNVGGDLLAPGLIDLDAEKPGIQVDIPLAETVEGAPTVLLRIATEDDEQDELNGLVVATVAQHSDHKVANYFTLAGDKNVLGASISILDNDDPPPVQVEEPVEEEPVEEPVEEEPVEEGPVEEPVEEEPVEEPVEAEPVKEPVEEEPVEEPVEEEPVEDPPVEVDEPIAFPTTGTGGLADDGAAGSWWTVSLSEVAPCPGGSPRDPNRSPTQGQVRAIRKRPLVPVHTSVIPASERESMRRLSAARRIETIYKRALVGSSGPPALGAELGLDSSVRWNDG